jgi:hypothetical protein
MAERIVVLLRFASIAICLIVVASFATFAIEQTKSASGQQQQQLSSETNANGERAATDAGPAPVAHREGSVHKTLDEASNELTSPFAGIVSNGSGEWAVRGVNLLLALVVYGFGLGYIARVLRVHT